MILKDMSPVFKIGFFFDLVFQNAKAGLRAEASRGYLGVLWWVIEPTMYLFIFYIVFAHLFQRGDKQFVVFLLVGLVVWKWFHASVVAGANSIIANAGLMNLVYLPKIVFPLTTIAINTFKFLIIFSIFLTFVYVASNTLSLHWLLLPILILIQLYLIVAVTCLLAAIVPFFPDLRQILDNIMIMLFFSSGIFFDISNMPASFQNFLWLNPMAVMISMYRSLLLDGQMPRGFDLMMVIFFAFIAMIVALNLLRRFDRTYPKIIN